MEKVKVLNLYAGISGKIVTNVLRLYEVVAELKTDLTNIN